jgi:hypothetical protein
LALLNKKTAILGGLKKIAVNLISHFQNAQ